MHTRPAPSTPVSIHQSTMNPVAYTAPATTNASEFEENPDNALLRGKMQRVQMMLAQRKEQRRTRREMTGPYSTPNFAAGPHSSLSKRHAVTSMKTNGASRNQATHSPAMCVTPPVASPASSIPSPSALTAAVDESSCMEGLHHQNHQHQQHQQPQKQPSGTACRNGGEHPCQTCPYCNPGREQDSLAV